MIQTDLSSIIRLVIATFLSATNNNVNPIVLSGNPQHSPVTYQFSSATRTFVITTVSSAINELVI